MMQITPHEQQKARIVSALNTCLAVFDAIKESGEIPAGHLFATCMQGGMSIGDFEWIIATGCSAGVISRANDVLRWVGAE